MKRRENSLLVLAFGLSSVWSAHCGNLVRGDDGAADGDGQATRVPEDGRLDAHVRNTDGDAGFTADVPDIVYVAWDAPASTDVQLPPSTCDGGQCSPPEGGVVPPETNQSCRGANGAPAEHCREVWAPGGPFTMGSLLAYKKSGNSWIRQDRCDIANGTVHPGFVDAYPVSVARYRAFVRAGSPAPPVGANIFEGWLWTEGGTGALQAPIPTDANDEYCSYRPTPGEHDDLPMNCLGFAQMMAFCYWDGKHYATEPMWEYVATNGGTTTRPFAPPSPWDVCEWGDVSLIDCRPGTAAIPVPITSFPQSQTTNPAGIFGLWAGAPSYLFNSRLGCGADFLDRWRRQEVGDRTLVLRGITARGRRLDAGSTRMGQARAFDTNSNYMPDTMAIRCMRWVPESRS